MPTELIANSPTPGSQVAITTLAAAITSTTATTITTSAAAPSTLQGGQFRIVIDSEIMLVTAGQSGTSWTVTRGPNLAAPDTCTATTHSSGASVFHDPTAGALTTLVSQASPGVGFRQDIAPWIGSYNRTGSWSIASITGSLFCESTAQNNQASWDLWLPAGTYAIDLMYITEPSCGIITVELDGTSLGTVDTYSSASEVNNVIATLSGVTVGSSGKHTLTLLMATKNASSSGYVLLLQWLTARRTA